MSLVPKTDDYYMKEALKEAAKAFEKDEVPIGAVIALEGKVVARAHNQMEILKDATAHAEILAITQASATIENWRLDKATLYVTKEPCLMCLGAVLNSRISRVVMGMLDDHDRGVRDLLHPGYEEAMKRVTFEFGLLEKDCTAIVREFFKKARNKTE